MKLVLASESPRRKMLLESAGITPVVVPSNVDEDAPVDDMDPGDLVKALARRKIRKVAERLPDDYVLGGDTIVYIDGKVLGKPADKEQARDMLRRICGRTHEVFTGVALYEPLGKTVLDDFDATRVTIRDMDEEEIRWYVDTEEPMDKAGSYALQGAGAFFVERVEGDFSGVIGLPLPKVYSLLRRAGVSLKDLQEK
ncbi:MAG: Maf family protein [Bacillota bacterium]